MTDQSLYALREEAREWRTYTLRSCRCPPASSCVCDSCQGADLLSRLLAALPRDGLCSDCPPVGYPTDKTRCTECPRRAAVPEDRASICGKCGGSGLHRDLPHHGTLDIQNWPQGERCDACAGTGHIATSAPEARGGLIERALCQSGKFETGQGTCALICMDQLGDARKKGCCHANKVHGKLAAAILAALSPRPATAQPAKGE